MLIQSLSLTGVLLSAVLVVGIAGVVAPARTLMLIRRARWLLLSIFVLFVFGTPGERLGGTIGDLGVTRDGLVLAVEHLVRLVLLLAALAAVHEYLGTSGLMAGLYWVLAPLAPFRSLRDRIVVRLMLVIEYVEAPNNQDWRTWLSGKDESGPPSLSLSVRSVTALDWLIMLALLAFAAAGWGGR